MLVQKRQILKRHRASLHGTLRLRYLNSEALALRKPYYVYAPPGSQDYERLPLLYLFRGHQREWVNIREDASRKKTTAVEDLDRRIAEGVLPRMVVIFPGLNSANNHVPSLGIDMVGKWPTAMHGLGTGRFWQFLTRELLPTVERAFPETHGGSRLAAGFSLGGYTVSLLATQLPGYFDHAGIYDGLFMWPGHSDPRKHGKSGCTDAAWCASPLFDAALGAPRNPEAMRSWNPTDTLIHADEAHLEAMRKTTFWINSAPSDGTLGNIDRTRFYVDLLRKRGLHVGYSQIVLDPEATHTWHWTDRFLMRFLHHALGTGAIAGVSLPRRET